MVPIFSTTNSQPATPGTFARPVVSIVLTEPPPPEPSTRRINGSLKASAISSHMLCLPLIVASAEPPLTVKSSPPMITGLPLTLAFPKTKFDGVSFFKLLSESYSAKPPIFPVS